MKRLGLFLGVNNYDDGSAKLSCAVNDAKELASLFADHGFEAYVGTDEFVHRQNILNEVQAKTQKLQAGDLFVLFFAGHGHEEEGKPYLDCIDGPLSIYELQKISQQNGLYRLFIFDCCRSNDNMASPHPSFDCWNRCGSTNRRGGEHQRSFIPTNMKVLPPFIVQSCCSDETAAERQDLQHGIFTGTLCNVLQKGNPTWDPASLFQKVSNLMNNESDQNLSMNYPPLIWQNIPIFADEKADCVPPPIASEDDEFSLDEVIDEANKGNAWAQFELGGMYYDIDEYPVAVEWFRKAAKQGLPEAQYCLGMCCLYGAGTARDFTEAQNWLIRSAKQGNLEAQKKLADILFYDEKKYPEAENWYRKAAEQGDIEALSQLGACCSINKKYSQAVEYYREAAEQGHNIAQYNLGICYFNGSGIREDHWAAARWYRKAAEQGLALAQFKLGMCCLCADGEKKNFKEAAEWFRRAAEQGLDLAQDLLGMCYANGLGVNKKAKEAVRWYRKSAEQGLADAQFNLAQCYVKGDGVKEKNSEEAAKWYLNAAEQGLDLAQFELGKCYDFGEGIEKNPAEAVKWYSKAAEQGHADAQLYLGLSYADGDGVAQDLKEAVKWFSKAAEQGNAVAQYYLGKCYFYGDGETRDLKKAETYIRKAAAQGDADAQEFLREHFSSGSR